MIERYGIKTTPKKAAKEVLCGALNCIDIDGELEGFGKLTEREREMIETQVEKLRSRLFKILA
jgi:hypothetical protein